MPPQQPVKISVAPQCQQNTNGCGTTCLAIILQAFGKKISREALDARIRRLDSFSAPALLKREALSHGMSAWLENKADFERIQAHLELGRLLIALHRSGPYLHYEVIYGCETDPDNDEKWLWMTHVGNGSLQKIKYSNFYALQWQCLKWGLLPTGFNCFLIVVDPHRLLSFNRMDVAPLSSQIATGVSVVINMLAQHHMKF